MMNKKLLTKFRHKNEACKRLEQGSRRTVKMLFKCGLRKAKIHLDSNLVRGTKGIKDFCKYISNKRKTKESVGLLMNWAQNLVRKYMEKASAVLGPTSSIISLLLNIRCAIILWIVQQITLNQSADVHSFFSTVRKEDAIFKSQGNVHLHVHEYRRMTPTWNF